MLTDIQKRTAQAIVNIFETGTVLGNYGKVTVLEGDSGHLTYGKSQTTLGSGNLHKLIAQYCQADNARFAEQLRPYLSALEERNTRLDNDLHLHNLLSACADDPVMISTQDAFFDEEYWQTAVKRAQRQQLQSALGMCVVYDSTIHGSWHYMRRRTNDRQGHLDLLGEKLWITSYVHTRRDWLANHRRRILRNTTYRMDAFIDMIIEDYWDLPLPMVVRRKEISNTTLNGTPIGSFSGPDIGSRDLSLTDPILRGLDVRALQLAFSTLGYVLTADGLYGRATNRCLNQYQTDRDLPTDEQVSAADLVALIEDANQQNQT